MRSIIPYLLFLFLLVMFTCSCRRDKTLTDPSAKLSFSMDTVLFDTVFTSIGSSTKQLKIYNNNNSKVIVSNIRLGHGNASPYRFNVDGIPGPSVKDLEILAKDSIFLFVEVTVDPLNSNSPLIVTDSILFETNGNQQDVNLVAWGQNAHYIRPDTYLQGLPPFSIVCDTTWTNNIPHVIYGYAVIDSLCKLTIEQGTQIHFHNNSGLWVYKGGSIKVNGTQDLPVVFQGDRLEPYYKEIPGQWDRIWLNEGSIDNEFNYAIIKNGLIGIQAETLEGFMGNQLTLNNSIIKNMSRSGIFSRFYKIQAGNTVISNCGLYAAELTMGGYYEFNHCTFANYWNQGTRKTPSVMVLNYYKDQNQQVYASPLYKADFNNSIIYGSLEDEVLVDDIGQGVDFNYGFNYTLVRTAKELSGSLVYKNEDPQFTDITKGDFSLKPNSFAIEKGSPTFVTGVLITDINGNIRSGNPDLGAFEFTP
ncbi:MAG: hypothetical protein H0V01_08825 [Bacteroidetes bacterium]|nr:hypothetical protein [Bacteroidota bacterium]HET6244593.1 hypothetical protein [Bacteroidia bacterium]